MNTSVEDNKIELLGGIGIDLTEESKQVLFKLIESLIPNEDYFQSSDAGYTYINGNVTMKGHITICYGVKNSDLKKQFDDSKLDINWPKNVTIKEIQVNLGWQGLYYVIVVIPKIDQEVYKFNDWIRTHNELKPDSPAFDPHIALCYIKNNGEFPTVLYEKLQEELLGKTLDFDSVNFYRNDDKIGTIKISKG